MAVIEERKSKDGISYRVKIRLKGYKPQEATFKRKTDAKNWASSTEAAMREGRYFKCAEAKKRTLAELIDKYIETVLSHKSDSMKASQTTQLAWWKDKAGCRVGGGAYLKACHRPPLKLDVQFSRIQLSQSYASAQIQRGY